MENNKQNNKKESLLKSFSLGKIRKDQLLIALLFGILLLVIAIPTGKSGKLKKTSENSTKSAKDTTDNTYDSDEMAVYADKMEQRLKQMLVNIEGVGKVEVMITLKGNGESVVEKDSPQTQSKVVENDSSGGTRETTESNWEESTVYIQGEDGSTVPYVSQELEPELEGVLVIAQGGGNATIAKNICEAVQALFPIEIHRIKVMKMKS